MTEQEQAAKRQSAAPQVPIVNLDFSDPKVLMGVLAQMFQQQAESTTINKKLLEIELAKKEAADRKDAEALVKLERARKQSLDELKRKRQNDERRWAGCSHKDQTGGWTIWPIGNRPGYVLGGYCTQCTMPIEAEHLEYDAYGKATKVAQHPLYHIVLEREQKLYSAFLPVMNY
jgi:hypothetical protein